MCQLLRELASHITGAMPPHSITTLVSFSLQQAQYAWVLKAMPFSHLSLVLKVY